MDPYSPGRVAGVMLALSCCFGQARAEQQAAAQLHVTAIVRPYMAIRMVSHPRELEVSQADVARGYVETAPLRVHVQSNSRDAYALMFERHGEHFSAASIEGLGARVKVVSRSEISWRPAAIQNTLDFRVRLHLAPHLVPGRYPWPLQLSFGQG